MCLQTSSQQSLLSMLRRTDLHTRAVASKLHGQELAIPKPLATSKLLDHAAVTKCNNDLLGLGLHPASEEPYSLLQAQLCTLRSVMKANRCGYVCHNQGALTVKSSMLWSKAALPIREAGD